MILVAKRLRTVLSWAALLIGALVLAAYLVVFNLVSLSSSHPVTIGFAPVEPTSRNEAALVLRTSDYALQYCCNTSTALVPGRTGLGRRFTVRPGDTRIKGNFRSELRLLPNVLGGTVWYRVHVLVPNTWQESSTRVIAVQWHGSKDWFLLEPGKYPPLDLAIVGDRWEMTKSWDRRLRTTKTAVGNVEGIRMIGTAPLRRGRWLDWVLRVHWSTTGAGSVDAWLDGRHIVGDRGPNAHRDLIGPYLKLGVYVPGWGYRHTEPAIAERTLMFDDIAVDYGRNPFAIGAASASVASGAAVPAAVSSGSR
jgi:hypothetical protein